jgi:elongation factor G
MPTLPVESTRCIAFVGHAGGGKTTLVEALLASAGAVKVAGSVEKGTTVTDYDPLEREHGHSIHLAAAHFDHNNTRVHVLDTPGYPDFTGAALAALDAVETIACVVHARHPVELTSQRMMLWAQTRGLCRILVINQIDGDRTDLEAVLRDLQDAFGRECLPVNLPTADRSGVLGCFFRPEQGQAAFSSVEDARSKLIEQVVEVDEALTERYLMGEELADKDLHDAFVRAMREGHLVPVLFTSAKLNIGVRALRDFVVQLAPSPLEGNPPLFEKWPDGKPESAQPYKAKADATEHVLAHVVKVEIDAYSGRIGLVRVHQGTLTPDTQVYVGSGRRAYRIAHLFRVMGKSHVPAQMIGPGEIGAVAKIDELAFDTVLHDAPEDAVIHFKPLPIPHAVHGLAVRVMKRGEEHKLAEILHRLEDEDAGLHIEHDVRTHEAVLRGQGELHLQRVLERIRAVHKLDIEAHPPTVPYKETIAGRAEGHHRHKKQTGGAGQFGEVFLRVEPMERGSGFDFVDAVRGGAIPAASVAAVEKGVRSVLEEGAIAGYPLQDVRVTVYDGKTHPVDGKEIAFITAGKKAFIDAVQKARPVVLEPIVNLELTVPETAIGAVSGELSSRRGQVTGTGNGRAGMAVLNARAPLGELEDFHQRLKGVTGGQGSYTIEFAAYEPAPPHVQQKLAAAYKPVDAE